ncbi:MAG: addiction module toxin RelE [Candidatus Woesearchaeota archaeon]|jgi:YafQ family addiction module toxin component|nr:addiction module toxin RelE [Candidatus Woesearchaeota archaeon]MDP7506095.1 addiction module toxin RelE [Candidatus Woesearchaeota archaeon]MDP7610417.1 addiction module toxin RelE [Candidatus Woesearchaeota archaeon]|tara:strand:+ start:141 stop:413 length:273 start_codon:yes stop_codon:yes gene_type:complete
MYNYEIKPSLQKILKKLSKKDRKRYEIIIKKIKEIINHPNPHNYKNLKHDLKEFKRVHIDSHFVLTFKVDKDKNSILFEDFDHHDKINSI